MMWMQFLVSTLVIVAAGTKLTYYADTLCERYHLGRFLIGILLLGMVTSLPECITSLVAVIHLHAPDLAVGNVMGSNNFNLLLIAAMDLVYRKGAVTDKIASRRSHTVSACCAMVLTVIVMAGIYFDANPLAPFFSWNLALVAGGYFLGIKILSVIDQVEKSEYSVDISELPSQRKMWGILILCAGLVISASFFLTESAVVIAENTGWGQTFVGSLMLAFVTSLPEAVVTITALRMGSADMAIGNIFGSNMFNMFIIAVCGLFYRGGSMLAHVSSAHLVTGLISLLMTIVALGGIHWKQKPVFVKLGIDSWMIMGIFIFGNYWIYGRP